MPRGETGLLLVLDDNLSPGYWRDDVELTSERFIDLPDGRRGFRTSDVVRRRPDGAIEHVGRADDRVKVRGAMTSPSEVERALVALDDIAEAAVVAFPTAEGGTRLVAYVVPVGRVTPSGWQIRRELADRVRPHMVPSVVVALGGAPRWAPVAKSTVPRSRHHPRRRSRTVSRSDVEGVWLSSSCRCWASIASGVMMYSTPRARR